MVLLLLVILVGLTFSLLLWMMGLRQQTLVSGETKISDIAPGQPNWPDHRSAIATETNSNCRFYSTSCVLIGPGFLLRHADLFIELMSWAFVVTRFIHASVFVTSNDLPRSIAWLSGVVALMAMWVYFAVKILLVT